MPKAKIIIADGNRNSQRVLKDLLNRNGYIVQAEVLNAPDLLRKVRTLFPDLVIMDSGLPGGSTQEMADIILGDELSNVLVLMDDNHWRQLYGVAHIKKPYSDETLLSAIEICLMYQEKVNSIKREVDQLKETLFARKIVEKAKGILMKQLDCDEARAYRLIQKESMNRSISMKELARAIIAAEENKIIFKER